jgi:hypothetical protein
MLELYSAIRSATILLFLMAGTIHIFYKHLHLPQFCLRIYLIYAYNYIKRICYQEVLFGCSKTRVSSCFIDIVLYERSHVLSQQNIRTEHHLGDNLTSVGCVRGQRYDTLLERRCILCF